MERIEESKEGVHRFYLDWNDVKGFKVVNNSDINDRYNVRIEKA